MKNILYILVLILLLISVYFIYDWVLEEPNNKEPFPALVSSIATIVLTVIAWKFDDGKNSGKQKIVSGKKSKNYQSGGDINITNEK